MCGSQHKMPMGLFELNIWLQAIKVTRGTNETAITPVHSCTDPCLSLHKTKPNGYMCNYAPSKYTLSFKLRTPHTTAYTTIQLVQPSVLYFSPLLHHFTVLLRQSQWCQIRPIVFFLLLLFDEALMTFSVSCNYSPAPRMFVLVLTGHCCDHILHCSIISHYNIYYFSFHFG